MFDKLVEYTLVNHVILGQIALSVIFTILMAWFITSYISNKAVITEEALEEMPEDKVLEIKTELKETRYDEKSPTKGNPDVNRFGRWKLVLNNGTEITRMGKLSNILTSEVKTYHEIK